MCLIIIKCQKKVAFVFWSKTFDLLSFDVELKYDLDMFSQVSPEHNGTKQVEHLIRSLKCEDMTYIVN